MCIRDRYSLPDADLISAESISENRHDFTVNLPRAQWLELPVQYNPHWIATVRGAETIPRVGRNGLLELPIPAGASEVALSFQKSFEELMAFAVSGLSLLGVMLILLNRLG